MKKTETSTSALETSSRAKAELEKQRIILYVYDNNVIIIIKIYMRSVGFEPTHLYDMRA